MMFTGKLFGTFTTRAPLSHIGEAISTHSYLVQEPIIQPDGSLVEVFVYSGNAWRGQLRDLAASYMLDRLGIRNAVKLDLFHLLFSGGRIGGEQKIDLDKARHYREILPCFSLFGGGVDNQILPGKLRVSNCYPVCREAIPALPEEYEQRALGLTYKSMTMEKSFTRRDDSKAPPTDIYLEPDFDADARKKSGPADQMRTTAELLVAGVDLHTEIECLDLTEIEFGALVSALQRFAKSPHIGGQANKGHGLVALCYEWRDVDGSKDVIKITDDIKLATFANEILHQYKTWLDEHADEIREILCG